MLRLTQMELLGFKSFPHKTALDLDPGVNCIVGPNGSGKSNISDAILFAFGSQSGKDLRTNRLSGLIFAGTDQLRALNLASVTLHFVRTARDLPAEDDLLAALGNLEDELDSPELTAASAPAGSQLIERGGHSGLKLTRHLGPEATADVERTPLWLQQLMELKPGERLSLTRRVFRDGDGGYFINGEAVRRKDVDQLFNRYNLGRASVYSISQGEVEKKILETPQELREWLAEATGVALLLNQKQRAQGKLKRTQSNLERLEDIRSSTRVLVADLAVQRASAEAHLKLAAQLRAVELNEIKREVEFAQRQQDSAVAALLELEQQLVQAQAGLAGSQARFNADHQARDKAEAELARAEQELDLSRRRVAELEREAAVAQTAVQAGEQALAQAHADERDLQEQLDTLGAELQQNAQEHAQLREDLALATRTETEARGVLDKAQAALHEVAARQAQQANRAFELGQETARLKNEIEAIERHGRQLSGQLEQRQRHLEATRARLAAQEAELGAETQRAQQAQTEALRLKSELEQRTAALAESAAQIKTADARCAVQRKGLAELASRRKTIAELAETADDPQSGRQQLLHAEALAARLASVSDVTFPPELRPAFTRLLSHLGDALAGGVDLRETARGMLAQVSSEALLLSPAAAPALHARSLWRELKSAPDVLGALHAALGDVLAADGVSEAEALLESEPAVSAVVLRDGSALIARGYAYLGHPAPERALRVARKSDIAEMDRALALAQQALAEAEAQLEELKARQAKQQWERDELSAQLAGAQERQRSSAQLCERLGRSTEERRAELELLSRQTQELERDRTKLDTDRPALEMKLSGLAAEQLQNDARGEELKAARMQAEEQVEQARGGHATAATSRQLAGQRAKHLEQAGFDLAERTNNVRARLEQLRSRIAALAREGEASAEVAQTSAKRASELAAGLTGANDRLAGLRQQRQDLAHGLDEQQEELTRLAQAVSRLEQDQVALGSQRDRSVERVAEWLDELQQRYNMTLSQLFTDPAVLASPVGAELEASEAGRGKLREERSRLSAALSEIGAVNLLAIEQHQEHSARLAFMDAQAGELARAVTDLERLVGELDATTEQQYRASLRKIESRFNELYVKLFGSGWARLRFETPDSLIDSGVEVEVMLPGNRRHSLRSLSGGQRALIFLALFFAVHSVRSPGFCILDEVDAALDDANVTRFVKLIGEFGQDEQFIVISHNKATMETADRLVGVVGRPKGVSNLISVDLKEARSLVDRGVA
jgi:chromosome segregation protein